MLYAICKRANCFLKKSKYRTLYAAMTVMKIPHFIDLAFSLSLFGILTLKIHVKLCTKVIGAILKTQKVFSLFLTLSIPHILSSRWFHRGKGLLFLKIKKKLFVKIVFFPMIQGNSF